MPAEESEDCEPGTAAGGNQHLRGNDHPCAGNGEAAFVECFRHTPEKLVELPGELGRVVFVPGTGMASLPRPHTGREKESSWSFLS